MTDFWCQDMYKLSIEKQPSASLVCSYAIYLMNLDRFGEADTLLKQAVKLDPLDAEVAYNVCCFHGKQRHKAKCMKWLKKSVVELRIDEIDWADEDLDVIRDLPEFAQIQKEFTGACATENQDFFESRAIHFSNTK